MRHVLVTGGFDPLHSGHINYFKAAKQLGDKLIVGLNSDESVKILKGKNRPILDEQARATILAAFSAVDAVIIFNEETPAEIIAKIIPIPEYKIIKIGAIAQWSQYFL